MKKDNLLDTLGAKPSTNQVKAQQAAEALNGIKSNEVSADLTAASSNTGTTQTAANSTASEVVETKEAKVEAKTSTSQGSDDWTLENAMKEVKKLREENKLTRLKYSEAIDKMRSDSETKISAKEAELQELVNKAKELEEIKAKEEDRKRDLSERVAHREALLADLKSKFEAEKKIAEEKMHQYQAQLQQYKAEAEAQLEVYKNRLNSELASIPEEFKDIATYITKGAGDPRDALVALNEARLKGVFDKKTVVVSHNVPGAADGARSSKERLEHAAAESRGKMDSSAKIREGLKQVRSGTGNSAFRIR